jgi:excisionase family DNA binding protein
MAAKPKPNPLSEHLAFTIEQAAQVSSLGQTSIYQAIKEGHLKKRKFGTRTIVMRTDLQNFLDELPEG